MVPHARRRHLVTHDRQPNQGRSEPLMAPITSGAAACRPTVLLLLLLALLSACRTPTAVTPDRPIPPTAVPITNSDGTATATQTGPLWILISGVDEHGLVTEDELALLAAPDAAADATAYIHTGLPAAVYEIRQTGPQSLRHFYRVQTAAGDSGWVSDYYVRRLGYLFDGQKKTVSLYNGPRGELQAEVANVTPVELVNPTGDWWQVRSPDGTVSGWLPASFVKESPEPEFLLNQSADHEH